MTEKKLRVSFLVEKMLKSIPQDDLKRLHKEKSPSLLRDGGKYVRVQPYMPMDLWCALAYYGAFNNGETDFFLGLCYNWIEHRAIQLGLVNMISQHIEGAR